MSKSCSIFFYEGYVGIAPTIINLSKSLNDCGYLVTIYGTKNPISTPDKIGNNTQGIYFSQVSDAPLLSRNIQSIYKFKLGTLIPIIDLIVFACDCFRDRLQKTNKLESRTNNIIIGVDTNGSILALLNYYFFKEKFIYLSLEINHPNHPLLFRRFAKILKILECVAYRKSEGVIIQDEDRFKTLCEYNQYHHPKVFYLPNSASASDSLVQDRKNKNYFREKFNLNEKEFPHIILQAGMIQDAVFSKELAHAFASINNRYALVFHEREKRELDDPYIKLLQEINSKNLFLSLDPLPYEQIDKIYSAATIGLAFYRDSDSNFSQISMASGKISHYLKHGHPILVNNLESLRKLVEKYQVGVVIQEPSNNIEIESAIEKILNNYSFYSENARKCFEEVFDFDKKIKPILSFMANL